MLYNLDEDIGESQNVADAHPEIVERLSKLIESARRDLGDGEAYPGKNCRSPGKVDHPVHLVRYED
jgi:hypothetical protein